MTQTRACKVGFYTSDLEQILPDSRKTATRIQSVGMYLEDSGSGGSSFVFVSDFMDFDLATVRTLENALKKVLPQQCTIHIVTTHNHGAALCDQLDMPLYCTIAGNCAVEAMAQSEEALIRTVHTEMDSCLNMTRRLFLEELQSSCTCFYGIDPQSARNGSAFAAHFLQKLKEGGYAYTPDPNVTAEQYRPFPEGDKELFCMEFISRKDQRILGTLVRYAAHAVCCNDAKSYTADYPFFLREYMKAHTGGAHCLFLNGPCGEIAPALSVKSLEYARSYGETLAKKALACLQESAVEPFYSFRGRSFYIDLPVREEILTGVVSIPEEEPGSEDLPGRKQYYEKLNFRGTIPFLEAKYKNGEEEKLLSDHITVHLGLCSINGTHLLFFPGETFCSTARVIRSEFPQMDIISVTEHGRTVMYLPPEEEFARGGYESICKLTTGGAERILREETIRFLQENLSQKQ